MGVETGTNQSVERAAAVLHAFTESGALRVSEVARIAGLRQSTASRLLSTLEQVAFVERGSDGQYRLGADLITLAGVAVNGHPVHQAARQRAQSLAAATGLGANVAIREGKQAFYLCNFEGHLAPRSFVLTGRRNPLHATALGKSLLLEVAERRTLLGDLAGYTPRTITDHDALDEAILRVAWQGYSTETEELSLGRSCLAAPLRDRTGRVVAALSLSGPSSVVDLPAREQELSRLVVETADAINSQLGHHGPADHRIQAPPRHDLRS
ncbi:IclR family transcriptional regulator [Kribbella amoyensis]|uniref:IclR family transcriptional regulator n=1 Tax=Kribbella amoyensis TaxID=996641 RepID=A0A561BKA4_9ACTN|nr:IclR family transcriptional regulator [Kribbella amoyensis]TWD79309.1 IclR family transcriptional regulator [Kribbella amoyensis]